jgi:hypothetical protein
MVATADTQGSAAENIALMVHGPEMLLPLRTVVMAPPGMESDLIDDCRNGVTIVIPSTLLTTTASTSSIIAVEMLAHVAMDTKTTAVAGDMLVEVVNLQADDMRVQTVAEVVTGAPSLCRLPESSGFR